MLVKCPDAGCFNCEHGAPHDDTDESINSSCSGGGDHDCPACEAVGG